MPKLEYLRRWATSSCHHTYTRALGHHTYTRALGVSDRLLMCSHYRCREHFHNDGSSAPCLAGLSPAFFSPKVSIHKCQRHQLLIHWNRHVRLPLIQSGLLAWIHRDPHVHLPLIQSGLLVWIHRDPHAHLPLIQSCLLMWTHALLLPSSPRESLRADQPRGRRTSSLLHRQLFHRLFLHRCPLSSHRKSMGISLLIWIN